MFTRNNSFRISIIMTSSIIMSEEMLDGRWHGLAWKYYINPVT
jgi:hypothetical protein